MDVGRGSTAAEEWWNAGQRRHWEQAEREQIALYRAQSCAWCRVSFATEPAGAQPIERAVDIPPHKCAVCFQNTCGNCSRDTHLSNPGGYCGWALTAYVCLRCDAYGSADCRDCGLQYNFGELFQCGTCDQFLCRFCGIRISGYIPGQWFFVCQACDWSDYSDPPMKVTQGRTTTMMTTTAQNKEDWLRMVARLPGSSWD